MAQTLEEANEFLRENPAVLVFFSDESCNVGDALLPKLQNMLQEQYPEMKFLEINVQLLPEAPDNLKVFRGFLRVLIILTDANYPQARHISVPKLSMEIERVYNIPTQLNFTLHYYIQ